jgi:hypothetical protein
VRKSNLPAKVRQPESSHQQVGKQVTPKQAAKQMALLMVLGIELPELSREELVYVGRLLK